MARDPYGLESTEQTGYTPLMPGFMNSMWFGLGTMGVQMGAEWYGSSKNVGRAVMGATRVPMGGRYQVSPGPNMLRRAYMGFSLDKTRLGKGLDGRIADLIDQGPRWSQKSQFDMLTRIGNDAGLGDRMMNRLSRLKDSKMTWIQKEMALNRETGRILGRSAANRLAVSRVIGGAMRAFNVLWMIDLGITGAQMAFEYAANRSPKIRPYERRTLETGGDFVDTRLAQTQRARAIQAIHNTQMSTRAVLGSEAAHMHRY